MALRTPEDRAVSVVRAYMAGSSMRKIGETYGMQRLTVAAILDRYGVEIRNGQDRDAYSESDVQYIIAHYNVDLTAEQIGQHLGKNRNAVIGKAHRIGLTRPINSGATGGGTRPLRQEMRT